MSEEDKLRSMYFMEFVGSFFIVFTIHNCTDPANPSPFGVFAIALSFFVSVFLSAQISGAHLNGAVTLLIYLKESKEKPDLDPTKYYYYFASQVAGGLCAGLVSSALDGNLAQPQISGVSNATGFLLEAIFAMVLCLCVRTIVEFHVSDPALAGLIVAAVIFVEAIAIGPFTGGVINPSIGTALIGARAFAFGSGQLTNFWIYLLAPCVGAYAAHVIFDKYVEFYKEQEAEKKKSLREGA
jgi:aquaporin Z